MTQEEKLEEAKRLYKDANADQRYVLRRLFPELKESEDERIRKEIVEVFKSLGDGKIPTTINYANIFTWLEEQNENISNVEDDSVRKYMKLSKFSLANMLAERDKTNAETIKAFEELEKQGGQKPADNVEPKFKKD